MGSKENLPPAAVVEINVEPLSVNPSRPSWGNCYDSVGVQLFRYEIVNDLMGRLEVATTGGSFFGQGHANTLTLVEVKRLADELAKKMAK